MMIDLTRTPLSELLQMQEQLPAEIQRRRSLEREQVMKELSALARARGFVLEDLWEGKRLRRESHRWSPQSNRR